jgi:hypothetical protein
MKKLLLLLPFLSLISCLNKESSVKTVKNVDAKSYEIIDSWSDSSSFGEKNYTFAITDESPLEISSESNAPIDIELINLRTNNIKVSFRGKKAYHNVQLPLDNYRLKIFPVDTTPTEYKITIKGPKYQPVKI